MLKNYLKIALRTLRRNKVYSFINILGLAVGFAVSMLILLYVYTVLTYDRFHEKADSIYLLYRTRPTPEKGLVPIRETWMPLLPEVKRTYTAIVDGVRFVSATTWVRYEDRRFREDFYAVDPSLFTMFSFPLKRGNPKTVLSDPHSVVVSEAVARKYFGNEDPVGKILNFGPSQDYTVTGVLGELPPNSSFTFNLVAPLKGMDFYQNASTDWGSSYLYTYVQLDDGVDPKDLEAQFPPFVKKYISPKEQGELLLLPLTEVHHRFTNSERYAYTLLAIAVSILLIASINFMNLTTARSMLRAREIGMRKVLGAVRNRLMQQFLGESLLVCFIALFVGSMLAEILLPYFKTFVGMELRFDQFFKPVVLGGLLALGCIVGLFSGSYPALFLSKFQPVTILKSGIRSKPGGTHLRSGLVAVQFAMSIVLLVGIGVIYRQVQYMKSQNLRFDKNQVLVIPLRAGDFDDPEAAFGRIAAFKNSLAGLSGVEAVAASASVPGRYNEWWTSVSPAGWEDRHPMVWRRSFVDDQYFKLYGIEFLEGRNFSEEFATDQQEGVIINEAALKASGWQTAVGKRIRAYFERENKVIGVVEDFHYESLQNSIRPVIHLYGGARSRDYRYFSVKLAGNQIDATLQRIREHWRTLDPTRAFEYFFVDESFDRLYRADENSARIVGYAALLAILIACLGLFGLSSFTVVQRTKEIGVRKVLGASVASLFALLSKDFVKLVLIANVVAWPVAYFAMNKWLQDFAYRIDIGWWVFALAGGMALLIALLTVSTQAIKAALANPVEALRYE
ncbi:ABC transporter permease [candidate division KSB1 bacterium]|nr:ABC transporter permease [candidate division KSB1 bacterium]